MDLLQEDISYKPIQTNVETQWSPTKWLLSQHARRQNKRQRKGHRKASC